MAQHTFCSSKLVSVPDFKDHAKKELSKIHFEYFNMGAGREKTRDNNEEAFLRLYIRPRYLKDVSERKLEVYILDKKIEMPIGIAPTAFQKIAHAKGECASVQAANKCGTIFIASSMATTKLEDIAEAAPKCIKWFQMSIFKDKEINEQLAKRAELAGYKAIVLTIDAPVPGIRHTDQRNNFSLPSHLKYSNFEDIARARGVTTNELFSDMFDPSFTWDKLYWFKSLTKLPIVLKGILTGEDAKKAVEYGVKGIIVSNHGGRQLDGVPATIESLPEIVKAVDNKIQVYMDGGIRDGTDVFKALALGAKMVFIGRPAIWGLTQSGEEGVKRVLDILKKEFDTTMALAGCAKVKDIKKEMVAHITSYYNLSP